MARKPRRRRYLQSLGEVEYVEQVHSENEHHERDYDSENNIDGEPDLERTPDEPDRAAEDEEAAEPADVEKRLRAPRAAFFCGTRRERQNEPADNSEARRDRRNEPDHECGPVTHT